MNELFTNCGNGILNEEIKGAKYEFKIYERPTSNIQRSILNKKERKKL